MFFLLVAYFTLYRWASNGPISFQFMFLAAWHPLLPAAIFLIVLAVIVENG